MAFFINEATQVRGVQTGPVPGIKLFHRLVMKQEGQVALNRSPEFCLKLTYRNLLKADHVPGETWGKPFSVPRALFEQTLKRSTR